MRKPSIGDVAPDFEGITHLGERIRLSDFRGKIVVLYFYPRAMTSGCTKEAIRFEQLSNEFKKMDSIIIGVSTDSPERNKKFAEKYSLNNIILIGDPKAEIVDLYGVRKEGTKRPSALRVTFIIDKNQVIKEILANIKPAERHADIALETVRRITGG